MSEQIIESEVTGSVWKIQVKEGDSVSAGDELMILESMKMEIPVEAPCDGVIGEILVKEEDAVDEDQALIKLQTG